MELTDDPRVVVSDLPPDVTIGGRCTSGFDATSTVINPAPELLTAGHCFADLAVVAPVGVVTARFWPGGDVEAIQQATPATNDVVWTAAGDHRSVHRVVGHGVSEAVGAAVCRTGIATENQCGTILALNVTVTYASGGTVPGLTKASNCAQPGDSGGPWMSASDAYGITSGGSIGPCTSTTYSLYSPAPQIESSLGLRINTANVV
jgi:streptogrisin C